MKDTSMEWQEDSVDTKEKRDNLDTGGKNIDETTEDADGGLSTPLKSARSKRISLESVRMGKAGLNRHRRLLLDKVRQQDTWSWVERGVVTDDDLAFLSAATGDEFALMTGKHVDLLYHGTKYHCRIERHSELMEMLMAHKLRLEAHTHPDYDLVSASDDDRKFIALFGQKTSRVISSYTGISIEFHADRFKDIYSD